MLARRAPRSSWPRRAACRRCGSAMSPDSISSGDASSGNASRRILAVVLPDIFLVAAGVRTLVPAPRGAASKRARARHSPSREPQPPSPRPPLRLPQAVVLLPPGREQVEPSDRLSAVTPKALQHGVRPGQTVTEARALLAALGVLALDPVRLDALLLELGDASRVAIASGPRLATAVARLGQLDARGARIVPAGEEASAVRELPIAAFAPPEQTAWFARLGLVDMAQMLALEPSALAARLGPTAPHILALGRGIDDEPLVPLAFPREIRVSLEWDEGLVGLEPLLFVLRGLASRVSARLGGRGEAAAFFELCLRHDPAVSRYRGTPLETKLSFELSSPIFRDVEFERVLRTRLERTSLPAPTLGVTLEVSRLSERALVQLELGTRGASRRLQDLPVLLAELETDVGAENLGILSIEDTHAPETRSRLEPIGSRASKPRSSPREPKVAPPDPLARATRLLGTPAALPGPLRVGESFVLGRSYYTIEKLEFATRLDSISWWTSSAQSRDYVWAWLSGSSGGLQALLFVDRRTKRAYVQGLAD